jgi:beta-glucuronidase
MEHKPVIMSEFGAAAIYGHHTFDNIPWTEEYQAELITHCLKLFREDDMFVGALIWQFCNIRTCKEMGLNRARGFNNKGLLDEYRRPKSAYFAAKKIFKG